MMERLHERFTPIINQDTHNMLSDKARALVLKRGQTIDEYFDAHSSLRDAMVRASFPLTSSRKPPPLDLS